MNAAQASRLARLLTEAAYPRSSPIDGKRYTIAELEEAYHYGEPSVQIKGYDREAPGEPEMMEVRLHVPGFEGERELFADPAGRLFVWSTIGVPAEDCECSCEERGPFGGLDRCPRHGGGRREIECFRAVTAIGWEIVDVPSMLRPATVPTWRYVVREGDPMRDVLAEYRAERERAVTR